MVFIHYRCNLGNIIGRRSVWSLKQKTSISSRLSLKSIDWSTALQCFPVLLHLPFLPIPSVVQELHGLIPGQLISLWRNVLEIKAGTCELDCSKNDSSCQYIIYIAPHMHGYIATYVCIYIYNSHVYIYIIAMYTVFISYTYNFTCCTQRTLRLRPSCYVGWTHWRSANKCCVLLISGIALWLLWMSKVSYDGRPILSASCCTLPASPGLVHIVGVNAFLRFSIQASADTFWPNSRST